MTKKLLTEVLDHRLWERFGGKRTQYVLAGPVSDTEAARLFHQGFDRAYAEGAADAVDRAFDDVVRRRRRPPRVKARPGVPSVAPATIRGDHDYALSAVLIRYVEGPADPFGVRHFRRTVLQDQRVRPDDVGTWLRRASAQAGPAPGSSSLLRYREPDGRIGRVGAPAGSSLADLRRISEQMAAFGGWVVDRISTYVLTGEVPQLSGLHVHVRREVHFVARSRIILTVDPTCTPREVANAYAQHRRAEFGRQRRLSTTHARLAIFAATHPQPSQERLTEWNHTQRPKYRYQSPFDRDCLAALGRLTNLRRGDR